MLERGWGQWYLYLRSLIRILSILRYLQTTEDEINSQGVSENPIDAFHLLRRWVQDWEKCFERVFCDDCVENGPAIGQSIYLFLGEAGIKGCS